MRFPHVLFFFLLSVSLTAAGFPDGRQLLAHSDDALFTARTVRLEFDATAEVSVSGLQTKVLSSELLEIGGGNRFRHSARLGENEVLTVSDGASVWTYSPKNKT